MVGIRTYLDRTVAAELANRSRRKNRRHALGVCAGFPPVVFPRRTARALARMRAAHCAPRMVLLWSVARPRFLTRRRAAIRKPVAPVLGIAARERCESRDSGRRARAAAIAGKPSA